MLESISNFAQGSAVIITLTLIIILNAGCVALVAFQLPGTWAMLAVTALAAWWRWDVGTIGGRVLIAMMVMAVIGELIETFSGSAAAGKAGGSKRGMIFAIIGAMLGAMIGSVLIPIMVVGTILGACIGAAAGSMAGDRSAGRSWRQSLDVGKAAATGRFYGTIGKLAVAVLMWLTATIAILWR